MIKLELTDEEIKIFESCKTLPPEFAEATDFEASEAIKINKNVKLPSSFSLWKWIYKTSNQWNLWACTSLGTSHWVQILNVKKGWIEPTTKNIITPKRKDLWVKMWHSTTQYDWGDYVEKAVSTALKEWILIEENWELARFDAYATDSWDRNDASIEMMKRYLYAWCPIVWSIRWNKQTWTEMTKWQITTTDYTPTWWHCIALVWRDESWMRFINSWSTNDWKWLKSRFHIPYNVMKQLWSKLNYRYWVLYIKEDAKLDPEYLKRKNTAKLVLEVLKKQYNWEPQKVKEAIVILSSALRNAYPELNKELPK